MADWGYRLLRPFANEVLVCDPRRNRLISCDGGKDDSVDPGKLAELYRLNALRVVHHPEQRAMMNQRRWVWLYHDQVELVGSFCMEHCSMGVSVRVGDTIYRGVDPQDAEVFFVNEVMPQVRNGNHQ